MKEKNRKTEEILIGIVVISLLALTMIVFERTISEPFEKITGDVLSTVRIIASTPTYCNFTLEPGLNLVSFFCIKNGEDRQNVIMNVTQLDSIFEYQEGSTDPWKSYNPSLPSFVVHDLIHMYRTEGYWIIMRAREDLVVGGGLRVPNQIQLVQGWNLAGYPTNVTRTINESFASISGNFTEVRAFNAVPQVFISYIPGVGGGLTETKPFEGYWINATANEVWVVD